MPDFGLRSTRVQAFVALALVLGALFALQTRRDRATARERLEAELGAVWLGVEAPRVQLLNHQGAVPLDSYRGRVVFVNFWATWCGPCMAEMPSLIALARAADPGDIAFVSVAEDDTWPPLDAYLRENPLPFDVYRDQPPRIEDQFQTKSYPTSFLIDREGKALYRFNGARDWDTPAVRALLELEGVDFD
ncbi:MAG: TlpA disulfide reductase family protein [Myxococcota bacterium]